ncbi:MAG: phosphodiester glycosidase family protein [Elainellaceae cyanobacterium]
MFADNVFFSAKGLPSTASLLKQLTPVEIQQRCRQDPNACPQAAYIWQVIGNAVERVLYFPTGGGAEPVINPVSKVLHNQYRLSIPGEHDLGSLLRFASRIEQAQNFLIPGYLASAGFHRSTTIYKYPCTVVGSFTIGWEGQEDSPTCDNGEVLYNPALREAEDYIRTEADRVDPRTFSPGSRAYNKQPRKKIDNLKQTGLGAPERIGGAPVNLRLYCSVAASSGPGWQVELASGTEADLPTLCNRAIETCEANAGNTCFVTRQGYWRAYHPKVFLRQVRLRFQCAEPEPFYDAMIEGNAVETQWENLAETAANASSCVLAVYNPDDILIAPDPTQRTLMHVDDNSERIRVTSLAGKLIINQPGNAAQIVAQPNSLSRRERFELVAGEQLTLLNTTGDATERTLDRDEREEIIDLPVVQAFLRVENWELIFDEDPIQQQIQAFRDALNEQFWQPPATDTELINGIWRATITLQPGIGLRLVPNPTPSVTNAARLESFAAANNNPDLVLGGLFQSPSFLASECRALRPGRGYATILGLTADKQPEMVSGGGLDGKIPAFDEYCFAITGGPRLLQASDPSYRITPEAARTQGHRDPNFATLQGISSRSARSAVCISKDRSAIYYAATPSGMSLSLPQFADILGSDEFGCGDAMNMDGGNPQVLYFSEGDGAPGLPPTGTAPPYWILVYDNAISSSLTENAFFAIVASPPSSAVAEARANEISQNNPDLDVKVFAPFGNSEYYSVAIVSYTSIQDAEAACRVAKDRGIGPDAFV